MVVMKADEKLVGAVLLSLDRMMDMPIEGTTTPYAFYVDHGYAEKVADLACELGADAEKAEKLVDMLYDCLEFDMAQSEILGEAEDEGFDPAVALMYGTMDAVAEMYGIDLDEVDRGEFEKYGKLATKLKC